MKRRLLLIIAAALLIAFTVNLTACGNGSASTDTAGTETKETGGATEPNAGDETPPKLTEKKRILPR